MADYTIISEKLRDACTLTRSTSESSTADLIDGR